MNVKYLYNDFPFKETIFNYIRSPGILSPQASNIKVLKSLKSPSFKFVRVKFDFLGYILSAALETIFSRSEY